MRADVPEKRTFCRRAPVERVDMVRDRTSLEAENISRPYIGLWLRVRGEVTNVRGDYGSDRELLIVSLRDSSLDDASAGTHLFLKFDSTRWGPEIKALRKGDEVTGAGEITDIEDYGVFLRQCELENES